MLTAEMITASVRRELVRFAKSKGASKEDAEDQVQDALIKAWDKRASYDAGADLTAWLKRFVHSDVSNQRRADDREADAIEAYTDWTGRPEAEPSEEQRAIGAEDLRLTLANVQKLPAKQRAAIEKSISGKPLSNEEDNALFHARKTLRELV